MHNVDTKIIMNEAEYRTLWDFSILLQASCNTQYNCIDCGVCDVLKDEYVDDRFMEEILANLKRDGIIEVIGD